MQIQVRCPSCGRGFLVAESDSDQAPCPGCGVMMTRDGAAPVSDEADAPSPDAAAVEATSPDEGIVCPRCGLHFMPRQEAVPRPGGERRTVLVVEDMDYFRQIARDALEPRFQVRTARNLSEARSVLGGGGIDLLLLDLTLEEENGADLLRELPWKPCPILIFTAEDEQVMYGETWERLQKLGADDVVIKGMNIGESIARKVGALLGEPDEDDAAPA